MLLHIFATMKDVAVQLVLLALSFEVEVVLCRRPLSFRVGKERRFRCGLRFAI